MKILLNAMKYDYGDPKRGFSFEYETFHKTMVDSGYEVFLFDFMTICKEKGKEEMNKLLLEAVEKEKPDMVFTILYADEFLPATLRKIRDDHGRSIAWMCDDKWRWNDFGGKICKNFNYTVTTDPDSIWKYESIGYKGAILSQWACSPQIHKKLDIKKDIDVSFIGLANPWRRYVIKFLAKKGINVECFGHGWGNGRVDQKKMIEIFNRSKINLNLSNASKSDFRYLTHVNLQLDKEKTWKQNIYNIFGPQIDFLLSKKNKEDMKARFFEVTGCSGFLLSYNVDHLDKYFEIGEEIVCYKSPDDLAEKIKYFLENEKERDEIAEKGYKRAHRDHTYAKRFQFLFTKAIKRTS